MRRSLIPLLVLLFLQCSYSTKHNVRYAETESIPINSIVGDSIDSEEREVYNLFLGVEEFVYAKLYALGTGGYETRIHTTHGALKTAMADTSGIAMLKDYLAHYEEIKMNRARYEKRWSIVAYDGLGQPITKSEIEKVGKPAEAVCGVGGCCLGLGIGGYVGYKKWQPEGDAYNVVTVCFVAPCGLAGAWAGAQIGKRIDRLQAIREIREARKPRPH